MTSPADLARPDLDQARAAYDALVAQGMKLDLTRGKPSAAQLDLAAELLHLPAEQFKAADGTDTRNYGGLQGLPELREIFAPVLQVPAEQLIAFGNGSLELMHDTLVNALLNAMPGSPRRWVEEERVVFLAPVPGYDRHFGVCERLGIELVPVPLHRRRARHGRGRAAGRGRPVRQGHLVRAEVLQPDRHRVLRRDGPAAGRHADGRAGLPDHVGQRVRGAHLAEEPAPIADLLALATEAGNADRVFVFGSTSKITLAGAGVAFFGASPANLAWWLAVTSKRTIGPDKTNHLRHAMFLRDADGRRRAHAQAPRDRRAEVRRAGAHPDARTSPTPRASRWSSPEGGYFVTLRVPDGCASEVVRLAKEAGIALTPAGATHPYGNDPEDAIIRLAPTFPVLDEVEKAMAGVAVCVKLALRAACDACWTARSSPRTCSARPSGCSAARWRPTPRKARSRCASSRWRRTAAPTTRRRTASAAAPRATA